jgi:hypothetical protein
MPTRFSPAANDSLRRSQYPAPFQLQGEYAVDDVINLAAVPGDVIAQRGPPVPQQVFPPKYGYYRVPLTIYDVLATDRWAPTYRSWTSGPMITPPPPIDPNGLSGNDGGFTKNALVGGKYEVG